MAYFLWNSFLVLIFEFWYFDFVLQERARILMIHSDSKWSLLTGMDWNKQRSTPLGLSMMVILSRFNWGWDTYSNYECYHPTAWVLEWKEENNQLSFSLLLDCACTVICYFQALPQWFNCYYGIHPHIMSQNKSSLP